MKSGCFFSFFGRFQINFDSFHDFFKFIHKVWRSWFAVILLEMLLLTFLVMLKNIFDRHSFIACQAYYVYFFRRWWFYRLVCIMLAYLPSCLEYTTWSTWCGSKDACLVPNSNMRLRYILKNEFFELFNWAGSSFRSICLTLIRWLFLCLNQFKYWS